MKHIFISHAGVDKAIAEKLCSDLRDVGHDVKLDLHEMSLGDSTIKFMNEAIADAHTVIIVFSVATEKAKWQMLEIEGAMWNEVAQDGGKVIPLKIGTPKLPPLIGPRMYGSLDDDEYKTTLQNLCKEIATTKTATDLVGEALTENSANPFWRVRAEYFEAMPSLMAQAFSPPVSGTFANWEEMLPCFLEGSRGTGKTMLLLSLRARILAARKMASSGQSESGKGLDDLFGIYVRLGRGAICNAGLESADGKLPDAVDRNELSQLSDLFSQEFYLCIIESLVTEASACVRERHIALDGVNEGELATKLASFVYGRSSGRVRDFDELLDLLADMHIRLADFIRRKFIYRESPTVPFTNCDMGLFKRVVTQFRRYVPDLKDSQFTVLLDEYENLYAYQKVVVNSLVKFGPPSFSVKVARKAGTNETSATNVGQELQESHDYTRIPLIYSVDDDADFSRYLTLLENMVRRILASHSLPQTSLAELLPEDDSDEVPHESLLQEVLALLRIDQEEFDGWPDARKNEQLTYYGEAAIYRHLYGKPGRRTKKRFSGHKDLAFISSGVIRYFQEIVGMAFHLQKGEGEKAIGPLSPIHQTEAVYVVSDHNLSMLSRNVETHGESLKYFLLDLGDCLRQKLLKHTSEPEAGRIAVKDPDSLAESRFNNLNTIIHIGVREGVFQTVEGRPGIRPKHVDDPQPVEINIARIYAPTLQISPRLRWPTLLSCSDLEGLLSPFERRKAKARLIEKLSGKKVKEEKHKQDNKQGTLFKEDQA